MTHKKTHLSALAVAVATAQALPPQYAQAQTTKPVEKQSIEEDYCRTQVPQDASSISALTVHLTSCMQAWRQTKKADLAWFASGAQVRMAQYHYNYQKASPINFISNAVALGNIAKDAGYDVRSIWRAGLEVENLKKAYDQKYGAPTSVVGTDNSLEAQCIYGAPKRYPDASYPKWTSNCAIAYNQHPNPWLAAIYASGTVIKAVEAYQSNNINDGQKFLAESKRFEAYASNMDWSTSQLKAVIGKLDQYESERQAAATQAQQQEYQAAQQSPQQPKSGLSNGEKLAVLAGGAFILALILGGSSNSSRSSSSSSSSSDDALEFERQRARERAGSGEQKRSEPEQRSYGFYGNCPAPGMGYGC